MLPDAVALVAVQKGFPVRPIVSARPILIL